MTKSEMLRLIEDSLDLPAGTLHENQVLEELSSWDSMAAILFMGVADEIGIPVSGDQIARSKTVGDLLSLLGDRITV
uniref:Carrier domain-containing protein n=1 Tax=Solibacter usitatus (strain Ellin6076) TaxID=234267 RepID=Q01X45_SOLUE